MHVVIIKLLSKKVHREFLKMTHNNKDSRGKVVSRVYHHFIYEQFNTLPYSITLYITSSYLAYNMPNSIQILTLCLWKFHWWNLSHVIEHMNRLCVMDQIDHINPTSMGKRIIGWTSTTWMKLKFKNEIKHEGKNQHTRDEIDETNKNVSHGWSYIHEIYHTNQIANEWKWIS